LDRPKDPAGAPLSKYAFDVRDFGAVGDGKTLCTRAIQSAVDTCAKAGGGRVIVPTGRFVTGPIFLRSNLEFEVLAGGTLLGSANFEDYPTMAGRWEGLDRTIFASLLTGDGLENVSITGRGVLDGQGAAWWDAHHKTADMRKNLGLTDREPENPPGAPLKWPRPRMINLYRSRNVLIQGLSIVNSPSWNVHPVLCEDVCIEGLSIVNPGNSPNTDGIAPDSCKNVRISDCYISTGDDCIVIKSGYKQIPGHPFAPSENIVVSNCVFGLGHCGVGVGSETAGGVRNVAISNCVCDGTRRGLTFKSARGRGSSVENVSAVNMVFRGITDAAIGVGMFYDNGDRTHALPVDALTPTFRNLHFSDIVVAGAKTALLFEGLLENPIQSLSVRNIAVESSSTGVACSGVRHAQFENVQVNPDAGPPFSFTDVQGIDVVRLGTTKPGADEPLMRLERVQDAAIQFCSASGAKPALIELKGKENHEISLALNRPPKDGKEVDFVDGATEDAIVKRSGI
jgi:polygalacturonase